MEPRAAALAHFALFYTSASDYARHAGGFIRAGIRAGHPVMVAVPEPSARALAAFLGADADRVTFAEMTDLGRNPARIIPAVTAFADSHPGRPVRYVGEPIWPGRTAAERAEALRHEALINVAFAGRPISILCPYDAGLDLGVLAGAEQSHPLLQRDGRVEPSPAFTGPGLPGADGPLPAPPAGVDVLTYRDEPAAARAFVRDRARAAGLREPRITDLVIAVGELAANTLRHTRESGTVRVWATAAEVICELRDSGHIRDLLAGRRCPAPDAGRGHGLWVVHQVCDLVEMRTGSGGTTFRLHMGLPG
jgi:anti-sigma regulatory factor (Ser/Thr protein kinase)